MRLTLPVLGLCLFASPALARGGPVRVDTELVFAVDVSYSMDSQEQRLQRTGYVEALRSPQFLEALGGGANGRIAVAYIEWASSLDQKVLVDWTLVDGPASADALAQRLADAPYRRARRTSVSGGIDAAVKLFDGNGFDGVRRVIDVSGDGPNNDGRPVLSAREDAVAAGITINGLPLMIRPVRAFAMDIAELDIYYQDCVVGGAGAFMIPVRDTKDFVDATRAKLLLDIARAPPEPGRARLVPVAGEAPRISCTIGERLWQNRMGN